MEDREPYILGTDEEELKRLKTQHNVWKSETIKGWSLAEFKLGDVILDLGSGPGPGGSGQNWFTKTYRERGIVFDRVLAWEAKLYTPEQWLSTLPLDVHDVVSFYNVAVDPSLGSRNNPLRVLQTLAHPNDFVVLKLDIDNCEVEEELVHQILNDSTLSTLIDELYWEHHVQMSPMQYKGWGLHINRYTNQTLASSYKLFRSLRTQGIRAHSWI